MIFNDTLDGVKTYEAGKPIELVVREYGVDPKDIIKLASNENPYGTSPKVVKAVQNIAHKMFLYPDDSMYVLKEGLSKKFDVQEDELIIGAGSDQVIEFAVHSKLNSKTKVLMNSITFAMYEIYARHVGAQIIRTSSREHDLEEFYRLYLEHKPEIIFICTPNNPTGDAIDTKKLKDFLKKIDNNTLVVVDGAYMEYSAYKDPSKSVSAKELICEFSNVLYLGTFSKAYGLGGMRTGYGIANKGIIKAFYKLRPPFNITTLSLEAATVALSDEAFVQECIAKNFEQMKDYENFAKEMGLEIIDSYTNFVTLCLNDTQSSSEISLSLLKKGMIVRDLTGYNLNAIRVTVGTSAQNKRFFELFKDITHS
ncbi:histidinol-phosphate transaminase [Sulfurimonas sp. MAG313]|nr:histidinol-phosphate transaminase [Sulfurimonas sp. MAG313]MDF1880332.1 histidinol-phosphate transaminase [Sulfurimonas sp. MAG313]